MAHIERSMFREYDIRGRMKDTELNPQAAVLIGRAYGTFLEARGIKTVVVGHDSRHGSKAVNEPLIRGILSTGRDVIDIGMCLTPMMYWSQYYFQSNQLFMLFIPFTLDAEPGFTGGALKPIMNDQLNEIIRWSGASVVSRRASDNSDPFPPKAATASPPVN